MSAELPAVAAPHSPGARDAFRVERENGIVVEPEVRALPTLCHCGRTDPPAPSAQAAVGPRLSSQATNSARAGLAREPRELGQFWWRRAARGSTQRVLGILPQAPSPDAHRGARALHLVDECDHAASTALERPRQRALRHAQGGAIRAVHNYGDHSHLNFSHRRATASQGATQRHCLLVADAAQFWDRWNQKQSRTVSRRTASTSS